MKRASLAWKERILGLLKSPGFSDALPEMDGIPLIKGINALLPFLYHGDAEIKRRAVMALGHRVAELADRDMDEARNVVRRLMWSLNEESGGIGWGSPEAMAEILARHEGLAREYTNILASYTQEGGNYLESEILQQGVLWGMGRVFRRWPALVRRAAPSILSFLGSRDPSVRALAARLLGEMGDERARQALECLLQDGAEFQIPMEEHPPVRRVQDEAREALAKFEDAKAG